MTRLLRAVVTHATLRSGQEIHAGSCKGVFRVLITSAEWSCPSYGKPCWVLSCPTLETPGAQARVSPGYHAHACCSSYFQTSAQEVICRLSPDVRRISWEPKGVLGTNTRDGWLRDKAGYREGEEKVKLFLFRTAHGSRPQTKIEGALQMKDNSLPVKGMF